MDQFTHEQLEFLKKYFVSREEFEQFQWEHSILVDGVEYLSLAAVPLAAKGYIHLEIWNAAGVTRSKKTPKEGGGYVYDTTTILTPTYKTDLTGARLLETLFYQQDVMMGRRVRDDRSFPDVYWMPLQQSTNDVQNGFTYVDNGIMPLNDTIVNGVVTVEGAMTWLNNQVAQRFRPTTKIAYNRGQSGIFYEQKIAWLAI